MFRSRNGEKSKAKPSKFPLKFITLFLQRPVLGVVALFAAAIILFSLFVEDVIMGFGLSAESTKKSMSYFPNEHCFDFECCVAQGNPTFGDASSQCFDAKSGNIFNFCEDKSETGDCSKPNIRRRTPFKFINQLKYLINNQTHELNLFKATQASELDLFQLQQQQLRERAVTEFSLAAKQIDAASKGLIDGNFSMADASEAARNGLDTWAFMIPVIRSNERRQQRLVTNICSLTWPPRQLIGITFVVDLQSRQIVEDSLPILIACGVGRVAVHDDPPYLRYQQPLGAIERHALDAQVERRASIAEARNYLLRLALQPRHTSVVWIDSDLFGFPKHVLYMLQQSGGDVAVPNCVYRDIPTQTYDMNSWQETTASRERVAQLSPQQPIFEGYEEENIPYIPFGGYGDAKPGQCKWQQTSNCDPDGQREWEYDLPCTQIVGSGSSGFCKCSDGTVKGRSKCKHEEFRCIELCDPEAAAKARDKLNARARESGVVQTEVKQILKPLYGMKLGRRHMDDLANSSLGEDFVVPLDGVGGTMIYARAEVFRNGVIFPPYLVNHQLETEGFAQMALQHGFTVVGLPNLIITHA